LTALAVIAGVGPGLGFSLAKQFSSEYRVVLLSRSQDKLDSLANDIKKGGGEVVYSVLPAYLGYGDLNGSQ